MKLSYYMKGRCCNVPSMFLDWMVLEKLEISVLIPLYSYRFTIVPVGVGPGKFKNTLLDENGREMVQITVARRMVLQSIAVNVKVYSGLGVLSGSMLTFVLGPGCPLV